MFSVHMIDVGVCCITYQELGFDLYSEVVYWSVVCTQERCTGLWYVQEGHVIVTYGMYTGMTY